MTTQEQVIGLAEVVGAVALVVATFSFSLFTPGAGAEDPLPWRLIAIFMLVSGANRLRTSASLVDSVKASQ